MILKLSLAPKEVYFIEIDQAGISLNKWSFVKKNIGPEKFYRMCVYRHVDFYRTEEVIIKLSKYINEILG